MADQDDNLKLDNTPEETPEEKKELTTQSRSGIAGVALFYEDDGVYISYKSSLLDSKRAADYVKRKGVTGVNSFALESMLAADVEAEKIAPPQQENVLAATVLVDFAGKNQEAWMTLYPPDEGEEPFTPEGLCEKLREEHGLCEELLDKQAVMSAAENKNYFEHILIATARPPVDGENGQLVYHFELRESTGGTEDGGKINFRELTEYVKAEKGQTLITRTEPTPGEPGMDVTGEPIPQKPGKEAPWRTGKNIILSEDKSCLISAIDGRLSRAGNDFEVSPSVKIPGDVDMSVGNIDFAGDIDIGGSIGTGFVIKASGNITVNGIVEGSELIAGGNITLKAGVAGGDKAVLSAGDSIVAKYVERASLDAVVGIKTEFALHSRLMSEGYIDVSSGKGAIIGGTASAGKYIVAKVLGADSGVATNVEIGISPKKRKRYRDVEETIKELSAGIGRMELALQTTSKQNGPRANPKAVLEVKSKLAQMQSEKQKLLIEFSQLEELMQSGVEGKVHVSEKVNVGVKLSMGNSVLQVRQENQYVTYLRENNEIVSTSFSYSKSEK